MTEHLTDVIRKKYGQVAQSGLSSQNEGVRSVAEAFGYSASELDSIPGEANIGLSCGNPTAMASLRPCEVVVDLGSGGGLDVFLAAAQVGPEGRVIGIDMTEEMIALARRNLSQSGYHNVEFHLARIDAIPLPDASVDCVISNCVINLAPDKPAVFREIVRILKPGGRLAVSDIALKKPLPEELAQDVTALVGCISGAIPIVEYRDGLIAAGFADVAVVESGSDLNAYAKIENQSGCCSPGMVPQGPSGQGGLDIIDAGCCGPGPGDSEHDPGFLQRLAELLTRYDVNEYAASVKIFAVKP